MKKTEEDNLVPTEKPAESVEDAFLKLEETIARLEDEEISLEDSFLAYREGMELLKYCNQEIEEVERKVLILNENGELDEF